MPISEDFVETIHKVFTFKDLTFYEWDDVDLSKETVGIVVSAIKKVYIKWYH